MPKYIELPDGGLFPLKEGESPESALAEAERLHPSAFGIKEKKQPEKQPKGGITGAFQKGLESAVSSVRTAGEALFDPEAAARAALGRQEEMGRKYADEVSFERAKKAYEEQGILAAAREVASQVPKAIAEQAPNIAATLGGARTGAALGSLAGPVGTVVGGVAGAALPTLISQFGSNIERQAAEGQPISRTAAGAAAVPQAALNVAGTFIPLGGRLISKLTGIPEKALAVGAGNATKLAEERLAATLLKGTAVGAAAEIPTEVAQQMLERMQAGLSLTSPDALAEYGQTAYQVGLLGPIGAAGRFSEKAGARQTVARQREEEAAKAAEAAEAAKNAPDALRELDTNFRAADQQLKALNEQVNGLKPQKGATEDEKAAYQQAKAERAQFVNQTYKPLREEYNKRKSAIEQMYESQQAQAEVAAAPTQATQAAPIPDQAPALDVQKLMLEQDLLKNQLGDLEAQLVKAAPEDFDALNAERANLQKRIDARAALIEERGGTALSDVEFQQAASAKMQALDTKLDQLTAAYTTALENKDYDKAAKVKDELLAVKNERSQLSDKTAQQMAALQEKQIGLEKRGETRDLFAEMPEQPEPQGLKYTNIAGKEIEFPGLAKDMAEAFALPTPKRTLRDYQADKAGEKLADANTQLAEAVRGGKPVEINAALKAVNKYEAEQSRLSQPFQKGTILDIFDPSNILKEAIARQDWETVMKYTKARDELKREEMDKAAKERAALTTALDERLGLGGSELATKTGEPLRSVERTQKSFMEIAQTLAKRKDKWGQGLLENYRLLRTGSFPDPEVQKRFDESADAYAYDYVMNEIDRLKNKVEKKQGNAKKSLLQQITDLAEEEVLLVDALESGIAKPTLREKLATLQAKLGKGEAPGERQMDAGERAAVERRLNKVREEYAKIVNKITPVKEQIVSLYSQLFNYRPLETKETERAQKQALLEAPGKAVIDRRKEAQNKLETAKAFNDEEAIAEAEKELKRLSLMSREQKRAKRMESGDVTYEAMKSEKLDEMAYAFGTQTEEFANAIQEAKNRLDKLVARYGAEDEQVRAFKADTREALIEVAIRAGRKTEDFKTLRKEQVEKFKEALSQSKQEVPTKRDKTPVTRKVTRYAREERTGSPESRATTESRQEAASKRAAPSQVRAGMRGDVRAAGTKANKTDGGNAYRLREGEATTVVDAAEAQKVIDGLDLPKNVKFVYAATPGKIPLRLLNMMAKDGVDPREGMVQGAVFPDGTVLVVGDQHADVRDLEETIAHELIGHYGIDTVIGQERLNAFAKKTDIIKLAEDLGGKPLVNEVLATVRANAALGVSEEIQKLQGLREIIAHTAEAKVTESFRQKAGRWLKELVGMVRAGLRNMGLKNLGELSTSDVFYMLKESRKAFANKTVGVYRAADGQTAFRLRRQASDSVVGAEPGIVDKVLTNVMGLAGRVQFIDQYAALDAAIKKGMEANVISSLEATNAQYLLRFGQQRSQFAGQFLTNGPVKAEHVKKADGVETIYRSTKGTSMMDVAQALNKAKLGNETEQENMFTVYLAGKRANQVGWEKLHFSNPQKAKAEYDSIMAKLNADKTSKDAFEEAAKLYQKYNAGLLDFLVDTGALSAKKAAELKAISYVPFYRINANGELQLMIDKETPVRISNIKDEPQLKELVGGNTSILPVFTSAAQNTFMLTGMGLRNQAVKETAFMLQKLGIASVLRPGKGPKGADVVRFKKNGDEHYAIIDTDQYGIPAELIVRGMEGIKTTLPAVIKAMGVPANILRSFVVRNPAYAVRQVIRDPLNAWLTTGTDATPVLSSMKELASMVAGRSENERKLMETGAISSNIYSGDEQDMAKFLKDLSAGKGLWEKALAKLDAFALQGDAATRAVIYKDSLDKGMTEQEALLRTLESMNFSRRGVSPSMQALSVMIPFFNAQVQGLDVIYRAFKGDMPYSKQLEIKEKMIRRGLLLAAGTLAYAAAMEDDEAYKRAKPEERLANWFVYVPGFDEPVRVPMPFEMGFLFKALPEAIWNVAAQDEKASKAMSGLFKLAQQTNPFSLPQAVKPLTEAVLGKSFYGGDIESAREKSELATQRYRESSTELAKVIGSVTGKVGVSPITIDYLIRGYTGGLGIAIVQLANPLLTPDTKAEIAQPTTKASKMPFIGGLFQPVEGRGTLDEAYDRMQEIQQTKGTYNRMLERGEQAEAKQFAQEYSNKLAAASISGSVQKRLGDLAKMERRVTADPKLTTEEKDAKLAQIDKAKMALARQFLAATD